jgi:dolichyl-phosphate-mannose-protein mannosyltransferase
MATVGGEPGGRPAIVVDDAEHVVAPDANTAVPLGIVAEPGKDVFAKDDRHRGSKSAARDDAEQKDVVSSGGDGERVVSVVSVEGPSETSAVARVEGSAETLVGVGEPLEAGPVPVPVVADEAAVPAGREPEGPLDHGEALANQVAHELYPEARTVPEGQRLAHDG